MALYNVLQQIEPSPVVELNRAVSIAMRDGPQTGLELVETLLEAKQLTDYHLAHSVRGELWRRLGKKTEAKAALAKALSLAKQEPERRLLQRRIESIETG